MIRWTATLGRLSVMLVTLFDPHVIISLFYLGQWRMDAFEFAHLYLWQALIMRGLFPGWAEAVEWSQRTISHVTTFQVPMVPGVNEGKYAVMVAEANPLLYSYGLPLFAHPN